MLILVKALTLWCAILLLAIANGGLREAVLIPLLGEVAALLLSGILLAGLIVAVATLTLPWLGADTQAARVAIGLGWLVLTIVFEFGFGLMRGQGWAELLAAYRFEPRGNIWPLVLLATALAPWLAGKLRETN